MATSSSIDDAVREHMTKSREHSFETLTVEDVAGEYCRYCGSNRKAVLKTGSTYELMPCRGLVG